MTREETLEKVLRMLWAETVASGNGGAQDFGWPAVRAAVLAVLPDLSGPATEPVCGICGLSKARATHDPALFPASHRFAPAPRPSEAPRPKFVTSAAEAIAWCEAHSKEPTEVRPSEAPAPRCPVCNGSGDLLPGSAERCSWCDGTGRAPAPEEGAGSAAPTRGDGP
jgi:hypothetical protein